MSQGQSFQGFLTQYCKELTSSDTTSLKRLFQLANSKYPRAYEPLLLLAILNRREDYLLKQAQGIPVYALYAEFIEDLEKSKKPLEEYLLTLNERSRFRRPLTAWQAKNNKLLDDRDFLSNLSRALLDLLQEKGLSRASACKIASTNKGNFYAFLKGDTTKLSRKTAVKIYKQICAL